MDSRRRPWTRLGVASMGTHLFYELAAGVAMPLSSVAGPAPAAAAWATGIVCAYAAAGRRNQNSDKVFGVLNGLFLSAVAAHFLYWPNRWIAGLPYLVECEGLRGRVVVPYNGILYVSAVAATAGLIENGRAGLRGATVPLVVVPVLIGAQHIEFRRLKAQAHRDPAWWNRRLRPAG
jgi:hypothetical protein